MAGSGPDRRREARPRSGLGAGLLAVGLLLAVQAVADPREIDRKELRRAYHEVLETYAEGGIEAAVADLEALEASVDPSPRRMDELLRLELGIVDDLLDSRLEVLLPVAQLHERAYVAHLEARRLAHAVHSRILVSQLVASYAGRAEHGRGDELRTASLIVTSLGARLQQNYMDSTAAELYREALALEPGNTAALLGLAEIFERHGQYDEAVKALERLDAIDPEHDIGGLRLAVNLDRLGRRAEAERRLRGIVGGSAAPWVLAVAYQELGRGLLEDGRLDEAREILEAAVRRLPDDPTLPVQLAYVTDRLGGGLPLDLGGALREAAGGPGLDSPRYRYSQMSRPVFDQLREGLRRSEADRLPLLADALDERPTRPFGRFRSRKASPRTGGGR